MGYRAKVALLCIAPLVSFAGCNAVRQVQQSAANSFHSSFRASFKSKFMESCTGGRSSVEGTCTCIEGTLERKYTDAQLMRMASNEAEGKRAIGEASRACIAKSRR